MEVIKKFEIQSLKINFEYSGETISTNEEPYKTLNEVKEKLLKKFVTQPPINSRCFYLCKDITDKGTEKIGNLFSHKDKIVIKLKSLLKIKTNKNQKITTLSTINPIFSTKNNFKITNISLKSSKNLKNSKNSSCCNLNKFIDKKLKQLSEKKPIIYRNKSDIFLPKLNNSSISVPKISETSKKFDESNKNDEKLPYPCDCKNLSISEYCRNCKKFICIECCAKQKHKNHLMIHLNMQNFEENIKIYGKLIQNDIEDKGDYQKNILDNRDPISIQNLQERKKLIAQKFENAINTYKRIVSGINENLKKENKERATLEKNSFNSLSKKINKELNNILEQLNKNYVNNDKKMVFSELRSFFDDINDKEETLNLLSENIVKYHLIKEINTKVQSSFDKIDRILSENNNEQNPFNFDFKIREEMARLDIFKNGEETKGDEESYMEKNEAVNNTNITKKKRTSFFYKK